MPHGNRVSSSAALKTNDMWSKVIGHDPHATTNESDEAADKNSLQEQSASIMLLAKMSNLYGGETRGACNRCGQAGHLTFQCRNAPVAAATANGDDSSDDSDDETSDSESESDHRSIDAGNTIGTLDRPVDVALPGVTHGDDIDKSGMDETTSKRKHRDSSEQRSKHSKRSKTVKEVKREHNEKREKKEKKEKKEKRHRKHKKKHAKKEGKR